MLLPTMWLAVGLLTLVAGLGAAQGRIVVGPNVTVSAASPTALAKS